MQLTDFSYELPDELIARFPLAERSASRLLHLAADGPQHRLVRDLASLLKPGDLLVFNDTRVLAARLFGNMMSGTMILAILLTITPFIFPIALSALGLLTGMVQAYIFSILAAVYIAAATRSRKPPREPQAET